MSETCERCQLWMTFRDAEHRAEWWAEHRAQTGHGEDVGRDLRLAACENAEVCDWTGVVDDLDSDHDCPQCYEPTVRYDEDGGQVR